MKKQWVTIQEMTFMAILVAMALVLDQIIVFRQPQGGSINVSMVPLVLLVLRFGFWKSIFSNALVYGLLANLLDGYGIITFPLDYFLALASLSLLGLFVSWFRKRHVTERMSLFALMFFLVVALRLFFHTLSGVWLYEVDWLGSFLYNVSYLGPSFVLSLVVLLVLLEIQPIRQTLFPPR